MALVLYLAILGAIDSKCDYILFNRNVDRRGEDAEKKRNARVVLGV